MRISDAVLGGLVGWLLVVIIFVFWPVLAQTCKRVVQRQRTNQRGFVLLLELIFTCSLLMIMMAMATVSVVRLRLAQNQIDARQRVQAVIIANQASAWCAIPINGCTTPLTATIPAPGSLNQSGYTMTFVNVGGGAWTYQAVPLIQSTSGTGYISYYADNTSVLRCAAGVPATAASGVCP